MNQFKNSSSNKNRTGVIVLAILLILSFLTFLIVGNGYRKEKARLIVERDTAISQKAQLQAQYDLLLEQLNDLQRANDSLIKKAEIDRGIIASLKARIQKCLSGSNNSKELREARELIQQLQAKIAELEAEIERLKAENEGLRKDKDELTDKNSALQVQVDTLTNNNIVLKDKVSKALVLMVGDVVCEGIKVRGGEEVVKNKRNKMSLLRVRFNILENRVVEDGTYDFYLALIGPNGNLLTEEGKEGLTLRLEDEKEVPYTVKMTTEYVQGTRKLMKYDYRSGEKFAPGTYRAIVYQKGYKVGEGTGLIKRGFLFF